MKHLKIFENHKTEELSIVEKLRIKCNKLQSDYMLSRDDEKLSELQYYQTLIHSVDNNLELSDKDKNSIEKL